MLRKIAFIVASISLIAFSVQAGSHWQTLTVAVDRGGEATVIAATDKFMASPTGKQMPGTLSLMQRVVDGSNPATHSFISSMDSVAAREKWTMTLATSADWKALIDTVSKVSKPLATYRLAFAKSYGDTEGNSDTWWELHTISVEKPAKYVKALDALMAAEENEKFPGSVWLSSVMAGGMNPVSHVVSVGYASAAEAEAWNDQLAQTEAWADFMDAVGKVSEFQGTILLRTLKTWGNQ